MPAQCLSNDSDVIGEILIEACFLSADVNMQHATTADQSDKSMHNRSVPNYKSRQGELSMLQGSKHHSRACL